MIQEDRELLAELARLNTDMPAFALRIIDGGASAAEQGRYAQRLIAAGERLKRRAEALGATVIEGEVVTSDTADDSHALLPHIGELGWQP